MLEIGCRGIVYNEWIYILNGIWHLLSKSGNLTIICFDITNITLRFRKRSILVSSKYNHLSHIHAYIDRDANSQIPTCYYQKGPIISYPTMCMACRLQYIYSTFLKEYIKISYNLVVFDFMYSYTKLKSPIEDRSVNSLNCFP